MLLLKQLLDRQPSPMYVPVVVTIGLLLATIGFATAMLNAVEQRARWAMEDERSAPRLRMTVWHQVKPGGLRYGQLNVVNALAHDHLQLVRLVAVSPSDLIFTELTNPLTGTMRGELRRSLEVANTYILPNGTYSLMIAFRTGRTPSADQGEEIALDAVLTELTPTARQLKRPLRFVVPSDAAKQ